MVKRSGAGLCFHPWITYARKSSDNTTQTDGFGRCPTALVGNQVASDGWMDGGTEALENRCAHWSSCFWWVSNVYHWIENTLRDVMADPVVTNKGSRHKICPESVIVIFSKCFVLLRALVYPGTLGVRQDHGWVYRRATVRTQPNHSLIYT